MAKYTLTTSPDQEPEGYLASGLRQGVTQVANTLSSGLANPFQQIESIRSVVTPRQDFREHFNKLPEDAQQRLEKLPNIQKHLENPIEEYKPLGLPTGESIKQGAESLFNLPEGYLQPKNQTEKTIGEFFSDLGSLISPLNPVGKGFGIGRAALASGLGNAAKEVARQFGFKEPTQEAVKVGGLLIGSIIQPGRITAYQNKLYDKAKSLISPETEAKLLPEVQKSLNAVTERFKRGHVELDKPTKFYLDEINDVLNKKLPKNAVRPNEINLKNAIGLKRSINKQLFGNPSEIDEQFLEPLRDALNKNIQTYGKTVNPEFLKDWNSAESIYKTLKDINPVTKFIEKNVTLEKLTNPLTYIAIGHYPKSILGGIGSVLTGSGGLKTLESLFKNKAIRGLYADVIGAALKKNSTLLSKSLERLDNAINEETGSSPASQKGKYVLVS